MSGSEKESLGIFSELPKKLRDRLNKARIERKFGPGEIIFREGTPGDGVYIIRKGRVMLYSFSAYGDRKIFDIISEGDVIGEMALIDEEPRSMTAETVTAVESDFISREDFTREILSEREAILPLLRLVVRRLRRLDEHVEEIIFQGVPARVAAAIAYLADRFGVRSEKNGKTIIQLKITHAELADLVGTSREYASKFIAQFQNDGILKCSRGMMEIFDLEGLKSWTQ
ncbi:MAG: Crp/Fnr family transcriptional regulator [Candidatus Hydrogenedentota bacterium]|nr:MAG: Crp/Fnr family transcriptional regulator [Candidatus Hydrogenedentota bacterium]